MKSKATKDPYPKNVDETTKARVEEIRRNDTNNNNSPGSNQEDEKSANMGPLGYGEQDVNAKANVEDDGKVSNLRQQ